MWLVATVLDSVVYHRTWKKLEGFLSVLFLEVCHSEMTYNLFVELFKTHWCTFPGSQIRSKEIEGGILFRGREATQH